MPKRKTSAGTSGNSGQSAKFSLAYLFAKTNRGLLLDLFVFVLNIFLMRLLTRQFINIFSEASTDDPIAKLTIGLTLLLMWTLPVAGAVMKRWHFHQRLKTEGKSVQAEQTKLTGCLFNPIFYFCLNLVITSGLLATLGDFFFGKSLNKGPVFVSFTIIGLILTVIQTYLIYRYFIPPKKPPRPAFLLSRQSETLGDVCLFLNMIFFQVGWNMLTFVDLGHPKTLLDFSGRLFFLSFIALLIYFPPRMFYLAEDIHRRRTWVTMLLANSPVIVRVLIGTGANSTGW